MVQRRRVSRWKEDCKGGAGGGRMGRRMTGLPRSAQHNRMPAVAAWSWRR